MKFSEFIDKSLKREDALFRLMYEFNVELGSYIEPSHLKEASLQKHLSLIKNSKRGERRLSEYLLNQFKLRSHDWYHFEEPRIRLALVDGQVLNKLLQMAGAALFGERIHKVITKQKLETFKTDVGPDLYYFISKRSLLLKALMPKIQVPEKELPTKEDIFQAGKLCFEYCFSNEPEAFLKRLTLKFPNSIQWKFNHPDSAGLKTNCWRYLERILIKEIEPKYSASFS